MPLLAFFLLFFLLSALYCSSVLLHEHATALSMILLPRASWLINQWRIPMLYTASAFRPKKRRLFRTSFCYFAAVMFTIYCLSSQTPNQEIGDCSCCKDWTAFRCRHPAGLSAAKRKDFCAFGISDWHRERWIGSERFLDTPKAKRPPSGTVRKTPARLRSPVVVSSDESGHEQLSETQKAGGRHSVSGTVPEALENRRCFFSH